jgi:hypothetical protein
MKNTLAVALCAIILPWLGGCLVLTNNSESDVPQKPLPKEQIVFKASGEDGVEFSGTLKVDGEPREIHGTTPWELPLECARLSGRIKKIKGDGQVEFTIKNPNGACSFSASPTCKFDYSSGGIRVWSFP